MYKQKNKNIIPDNNVELVKQIIRRSENPHPFTILLIIFVVVVLIYFMYIEFIKKSISGRWVDEKNIEYVIIHNKYGDNLNFIMPNDIKQGYLKGYIVILYNGKTMQTGVNIKNTIEWTDGTRWYAKL